MSEETVNESPKRETDRIIDRSDPYGSAEYAVDPTDPFSADFSAPVEETEESEEVGASEEKREGEQAEASEGEGTEEPKEGQEAATETPQSIKYKAGDTEQDLDLSAEVTLGDGQTVKVKQLVDTFTADESIRARFGKLGGEEQKLKQLEQNIQLQQANLEKNLRTFNDYVESLGSGDIEALNSLIQVGGGHPEAVWAKILQKIAPQAAEYLEMSEEQREQLALKYENESLNKRLQDREQGQSKAKKQQELAQYRQQLLETHEVSQEELVKSAQAMEALYNQGQLDYLKDATEKQKLGEIVRYAVGQKWVGRIAEAVTEVFPDKNTAEQDAIIRDLYPNLEGRRVSEITKDDLTRVIREVYSDSAKAEPEVKAETATAKEEAAPKKIEEERRSTESRPDLEQIQPLSADELFAG